MKDCWCEHVDIGVGMQKVDHNPLCPECNEPCPTCGVVCEGHCPECGSPGQHKSDCDTGRRIGLIEAAGSVPVLVEWPSRPDVPNGVADYTPLGTDLDSQPCRECGRRGSHKMDCGTGRQASSGFGYAGETDRLPDGNCPDWCPCHRTA